METSITLNLELAFQFLGINPDNYTYKEGLDRYRKLAKILHPDKGGDSQLFNILQNSWEIIKENYKPELPIAYFREDFRYHNEVNYVRLIGIYYLGVNDDYPYICWASYFRNENKFICDDGKYKYVIPESERHIINSVTHRCFFTPDGEITPEILTIKEIKEGKFTVFTEKGE